MQIKQIKISASGVLKTIDLESMQLGDVEKIKVGGEWVELTAENLRSAIAEEGYDVSSSASKLTVVSGPNRTSIDLNATTGAVHLAGADEAGTNILFMTSKKSDNG